MTISVTAPESGLRALVHRYRVHWSLLPKCLPETLNGNRIGFEFELWGRHDHPADAGPGECIDCGRVREVLREVGKKIAPGACPFRTNGARPADSRSAFHPRDGFSRHTCLVVEVVCRSGPTAVEAPCDLCCLPGMREQLAALGARRM